VLNDRTFAQRKRQLENREPPLHPKLEDLQSATFRWITQLLGSWLTKSVTLAGLVFH